MAEVYKCRRCLKRPNETYRPDPNEVLKVCAECGTENWCLPVRGKTKAKKASEAAKGEVAESIPDESVDYIEATKDMIAEAKKEAAEEEEAESVIEGSSAEDVAEVDELLEKQAKTVTEATSEVVEEHYLPDGTVLETEKAVNETLTEKETLLARLAKLDAEETE